MRIGRLLAVSVVSVASLIVLAAVIIWVTFYFQSRSTQQNLSDPDGQQARSPIANLALVNQSQGESSFLYRTDFSSGTSVRLTNVARGIESEAVFSHDGKLVAYSFASSPDSKSAVWVVGIDGTNPHQLSTKDEDALHPAFSMDDSTMFFAVSNYTGNHSPVARPARHDWDIFSVSLASDGSTSSAPIRVTGKSLYDLKSLDVAAEDFAAHAPKLLISTSAYPIGDLIEELKVGDPGRDAIFQPHVPREPTAPSTPVYGEARYINGGMYILFLAATDNGSGTFDYNVYSMSAVTGSEIKQLTHLQGMTTNLQIMPDGRAELANRGASYALDLSTDNLTVLK